MKKLDFEFTKCEAGWIDITIKYDKTILEYCFSYIFSEPKDLIEWVENVYIEKYSEFSCFAEGWTWYLDYDGIYLTISDTLNIKDENPEYEKFQRLRFEIGKEELCKIIYTALKEFKKSGKYNPREWEALTFKKLLNQTFKEQENIVDYLSDYSKEEIETMLKNKLITDDYGFINLSFFDDIEYNIASKKRKMEILNEYINDESDYLGYYGFPLLDIKSEILERCK